MGQENKDQLIKSAKVYIAESRTRRKKHRIFSITLLNWAISSTKKALECNKTKQQFDLFS